MGPFGVMLDIKSNKYWGFVSNLLFTDLYPKGDLDFEFLSNLSAEMGFYFILWHCIWLITNKHAYYITDWQHTGDW